MTPPDSGEREVPQCDALTPARQCAGILGHPGGHDFRMWPSALVSLPLPLAQRILAALEAAASDYERLKVYGATPIRAVIAELRSNLPKEPK